MLSFADFHSGRLMAVRAMEPVAEQDGQGDAQPVAAEEGSGVAVGHAVFFRQNRGLAERARRACRKQPLEEGDQQGQQHQGNTDPSQRITAGDQEQDQHSNGERKGQALPTQQHGS